MVRVRGTFEYPDDLTPGRSKNGGMNHNCYKDGRLVTQGAFFPDEDDNGEDAPIEEPVWSSQPFDCGCEHEEGTRAKERLDVEEILEAVVILVKAANWAAPFVRSFWNNQALPLARLVREKFARSREDESGRASTEATVAAEATPSNAPQEATADPEENGVSMSSEEAAARLYAAIKAKLFSDEQVRILRNARIEDGAAPSELRQAPTLTSEQVEEAVRAALEENRPLLARDTVAELEKYISRLPVTSGPRAIEK
ncbi:hypothetical protein [Streptomyces sp. NPDC002644]